jgi:hypothetical protein
MAATAAAVMCIFADFTGIKEAVATTSQRTTDKAFGFNS